MISLVSGDNFTFLRLAYGIKIIPYIFFRDDLKVRNQIDQIENFFSFLKKIIISNWDMEESKILVYERRYELKGLEITKQSKYLRHFTGELKQIG